MADEPQQVNTDPTPEELAKTRLPDPITPSERETFIGRIRELEAENAEIKEKLERALRPKPEPKKKSVLDHFSPL